MKINIVDAKRNKLSKKMIKFEEVCPRNLTKSGLYNIQY